MSRRTLGLVLLLCGSEILGLLAGEWFYRLFLKTVPPLAVSSFNQSAAHVAYLLYGAITGLAISAWAVVLVVLSRLFSGPETPPGSTPVR